MDSRESVWPGPSLQEPANQSQFEVLFGSPTTLVSTPEASPWVSPAPTGDFALWLRDALTCMGPWAGLILGGACALVLLSILYFLWSCRRRRRTAKVRRHVNMMQASDASLHTLPGHSSWSSGALPLAYDVPVPPPARLGSPLGPRASSGFPQLLATRPRQASVDSANVGSGITLRAEVLDPHYFSGTIKKKNRMNGDLAQAIAAFGLPSGRLSNFKISRKSSKDDDLQDLSSNMEVIYQERTAV